MIHLIGPAVLAAASAGIGVYGMLARRNAVLVLIGAELLLNAANLLLITASALPPGGLAGIPGPGEPAPTEFTDPLLSGQVMAIFVITIAAAEIGVALAVVLLLFRARGTVELTSVQELGEASTTYTENPDGYPAPVLNPATSNPATSTNPAISTATSTLTKATSTASTSTTSTPRPADALGGTT